MIYQNISFKIKKFYTLVAQLQMCIACGEDTYKPGSGCSTCGYVGD